MLCTALQKSQNVAATIRSPVWVHFRPLTFLVRSANTMDGRQPTVARLGSLSDCTSVRVARPPRRHSNHRDLLRVVFSGKLAVRVEPLHKTLACRRSLRPARVQRQFGFAQTNWRISLLSPRCGHHSEADRNSSVAAPRLPESQRRLSVGVAKPCLRAYQPHWTPVTERKRPRTNRKIATEAPETTRPASRRLVRRHHGRDAVGLVRSPFAKVDFRPNGFEEP